jgi:hypothetical protein
MRSDNPIKGDPQIVRQTGKDYIGIHDVISALIPDIDMISSTDRFRAIALSALRARANNLKTTLNAVKERYEEAGDALIK